MILTNVLLYMSIFTANDINNKGTVGEGPRPLPYCAINKRMLYAVRGKDNF